MSFVRAAVNLTDAILYFETSEDASCEPECEPLAEEPVNEAVEHELDELDEEAPDVSSAWLLATPGLSESGSESYMESCSMELPAAVLKKNMTFRTRFSCEKSSRNVARCVFLAESVQLFPG